MSLKRLVIVAGPTAVGKSFFLKKLMHRTFSDVPAQLYLSGAEWQEVRARQFDIDYPQPFPAILPNHIVLHYETTRTWRRPYDFANDPSLELLHIAEKSTIVTLWAPAHILLDRFVSHNFKSWRRRAHRVAVRWFGKSFNPKYTRLAELFALYRDGSPELERIYRDWFGFCSGFPVADHWIVDTSKLTNRLVPLDHTLPDPYGRLIDLLHPRSRAA